MFPEWKNSQLQQLIYASSYVNFENINPKLVRIARMINERNNDMLNVIAYYENEYFADANNELSQLLSDISMNETDQEVADAETYHTIQSVYNTRFQTYSQLFNSSYNTFLFQNEINAIDVLNIMTEGRDFNFDEYQRDFSFEPRTEGRGPGGRGESGGLDGRGESGGLGGRGVGRGGIGSTRFGSSTASTTDFGTSGQSSFGVFYDQNEMRNMILFSDPESLNGFSTRQILLILDNGERSTSLPELFGVALLAGVAVNEIERLRKKWDKDAAAAERARQAQQEASDAAKEARDAREAARLRIVEKEIEKLEQAQKELDELIKKIETPVLRDPGDEGQSTYNDEIRARMVDIWDDTNPWHIVHDPNFLGHRYVDIWDDTNPGHIEMRGQSTSVFGGGRIVDVNFQRRIIYINPAYLDPR